MPRRRFVWLECDREITGIRRELPPGPRLGARVVTLRGVSKRFGDRTVLPTLDLELGPGTRLGVVGPNGAGKTTLVRILLGEREPDGGTREVGETVRFCGSFFGGGVSGVVMQPPPSPPLPKAGRGVRFTFLIAHYSPA